MQGDGCSKCNPEFYVDIFKDEIKDLESEVAKLEAANKVLREALENCRRYQVADELDKIINPAIKAADEIERG